MANFVLGWPNRFVYGVISTSASEAALDGSKLANDQGSPEQAWQSPYTSGSIRLTVPEAMLWRGFGLFRTNLTTKAAVRWQVLADVSGSSPVYDSGTIPAGIVPGYSQTILILPAAVVGRVIQVDIFDPTNPDGFLNIPLAYAGPLWQPARNFDAGSSAGRTMQSTKTLTRAGGIIIRSDWVKRTFTLSLSGIRASEVQPNVMDLDLWAKRGNNVFFVPDPDSPDANQQAILGEFETSSDVTYPNRVIEARGWKAVITERL